MANERNLDVNLQHFYLDMFTLIYTESTLFQQIRAFNISKLYYNLR